MKDNVKQLLNNLLRAIEYEREEERERHIEEIKKLKGHERQAKGRAIINLKKKKAGRTIGGDWLFQFRRNDNHLLPDTQISIGDQVIISQYSPLDENNPTGFVYEMTNNNITVALGHPIKMSNSKPIRMDLFVNDVTFKRMEEALNYAKMPLNHRLHTLFEGQYQVNSVSHGFENDRLNEVQSQAVDYALGNNIFYSIQGPPGTGKTHTAAHLIEEILKHKGRILITADSNAAVDNLIRKLTELGLDPLRIGNPIRVNNDLKQHTLDYKIFEHLLYKEIIDLEGHVEEIKIIQSGMERPSMKHTRGVPYDKLLELANSNQTTRGIPKSALKEMKPWLKQQKKLDGLYEKIQSHRDEIQYELLQNHRIIATTNSTAGCELLQHESFDWLIMDEAAQASIPSAMIPLLKAKRFVLVGDHFQLPPVVLNREAMDLGLSQSLMDHLAWLYPYQLTRLRVQYRMHQQINDLVSRMFYNDDLIADEMVANRTLPGDDSVIELMHTVGEEFMHKDSKSYYNTKEMERVLQCVKALEKKGIKKEQIAIISPYKAQVQKLSKQLDEDIEVDTVDAFQGREKDVVIISFVRSNSEERIGFLQDFRRLNVSLSRAKSKLILIGNLATLSTNELYDEMLKLIKA